MFHPAMKHAIGPRRELAQRTIFNVLGPLTNPAGATHQLIGVFDGALTHTLAQVLGNLGSRAAYVVHGYGGLDELTTAGPNQISHLKNGSVSTFEFDPELELGLRRSKPEDIVGGYPQENAERVRAILANKDKSPLRDVILLNAAAALSLAQDTGNMKVGYKEALESLESGAAEAKMQALVDTTQALASGE
jgi:anthranilate phosphoribosyltransferase